MKKIKQYSDFLNETALGPIDLKKLQHYAYAIAILCNGEYGDVYFNDKENSVFICLGDANPFDTSSLVEFMTDAIRAGDYSNNKLITITIDNECGPPNDGEWIKIA